MAFIYVQRIQGVKAISQSHNIYVQGPITQLPILTELENELE